MNSVTNMKLYKHVQYCFCYNVIKSAGEAANKVLLFVVWNSLLIEINLSQVRTLDIKREKLCAVCPYLLLPLPSSKYPPHCSRHSIGIFPTFVRQSLRFRPLEKKKQVYGSIDDDGGCLAGTHAIVVCIIQNRHVHRCGTSGSMRACHAAGPGSIPGREKFPGWGFFGVFPHM